jgi:hypothetical protein
LLKNKVDAFAIGTEMIGLTKVSSSAGVYPAVNQFISLAATVKGIMGTGTKVTYAADWSEYHHTDEGWYNLDPLWASPNIDFIGIDAYFPLSDDEQDTEYSIQKVIDGWDEGEGYDFYYSDPERTTKVNFSGGAFAWKNIEWWWKNTHVNPDTSTTAWVPESKKIWFTEFGFPSVDGAISQPNVFYDPNSSESFFPRHSKGRVDFRAQRQGIVGTLARWKNSNMIEQKFLWTWDARPFPYWPDLLSVWSDGNLWKTGHWVQGKLGLSSLSAIAEDVFKRSDLSSSEYDVAQLADQTEGFVITRQQTGRDTLEQLMAGHFFDAVESDKVLKLIPRGGSVASAIAENNLLPKGGNSREVLNVTRAQEIELPQQVNIVYFNRLNNYQPGTQISQREFTASKDKTTINLPMVFSDQRAKIVADVTLFNSWTSRSVYEFELPMQYADLEPTDVITITVGSVQHTIRLVEVNRGVSGMIRVVGVAEDIASYDFYTPPAEPVSALVATNTIGKTSLELLDLPAFPNDNAEDATMRFAATGLNTGWRGAVIYRSDDGGNNYNSYLDANAAASMGNATTVLASGRTDVFDEKNSVTVLLQGQGTLQSVTELAVLNGANAAMLGNEIIQFKTATLVSDHKYQLSGLLRGRQGTEHAVGSHVAGERFVLLDAAVLKDTSGSSILGQERYYKAVTIDANLTDTVAQIFTYTGKALKPWSPVHVTGERDGSNNLTIDWMRRTRIGGGWQDGVDIPLNETTEAYEVEIYNDSTLLRTITDITSPQTTYTAAQQATDFGGVQSSVSVKIYQLSSKIGRGYAAEAVV